MHSPIFLINLHDYTNTISTSRITSKYPQVEMLEGGFEHTLIILLLGNVI